MTAQNLWNFIAKFDSKAEICWKLEDLNRDFLNNLRNFKIFVGTYITFLKGYDANYRINTKLPMNYSFGKNICAELVNTRGAAGEWLITDEFSTDLDEMNIFVISKDQTFRICATFLDPTKFSILVIHLIKLNFKFKLVNISPIHMKSFPFKIKKISEKYWIWFILNSQSKFQPPNPSIIASYCGFRIRCFRDFIWKSKKL